jgi:hypothetical protein
MEKNIPDKEKETAALIELQNRDVTDLLGEAPNWLIHTGSYLLYGMLILLLSGSALISYPDAVRGQALIEDRANVNYITANSGGQIETVFVQNDSMVKSGDTIALIQNPARLNDVREFCAILANVETYYRTNNGNLLRAFPFDLTMGDMSDAYETFTQAVRNCLIYDDHNYFLQRNAFLKKELTVLKKDPEKNELAILKVERETFELSVAHKMEIEKNRKQLELAYENMVNSLRKWESNYLICSHHKGRIVLGEARTLTRMVNKGDTIASIISDNQPEFIARMQLNQEEVAGVESGDPVNIRLVKYPAHTYGVLTGKVNAITFVPYHKQYVLDIFFPNQLHTTAKKEIKYEVGLKGDAEIITSNRSVLSRIFNPVYNLFKATDREE